MVKQYNQQAFTYKGNAKKLFNSRIGLWNDIYAKNNMDYYKPEMIEVNGVIVVTWWTF